MEAPQQRKRKGFANAQGVDIFQKLDDKPEMAVPKAPTEASLKKLKAVDELAKSIVDCEHNEISDPDKAFLGAQPVFLRQPQISSETVMIRTTSVACRTLREMIKKSAKLMLIVAEDSKGSVATKKLLEMSSDAATDIAKSPITVGFGSDWLQTLPRTTKVESPKYDPTTLLIYVGTPSKHLSYCIRSDRGLFDRAYGANHLVVLCKGCCMLPIGGHEENFFGIDEDTVLEAIVSEVQARAVPGWGHGRGTKAELMALAYGYLGSKPLPEPLKMGADEAGGGMIHFDYLKDYVKFLNEVKLGKPRIPIKNYYDTGLLCQVMTGYIAESETSLLMDRDGLSMLKDGSIGHIISKLNQLVTVEPYSTEQAVYNFFIGDGACRLNGGIETVFHLIEGYTAQSMMTFFVFNNKGWALEDRTIGDKYHHHVLHNTSFYDLLAEHGSVAEVETEVELREALEFLSARTLSYLKKEESPGIQLVVIRNIMVDLPPVIGNLEAIRKTPEMEFMRKVMGTFAAGCEYRIPIFGCSTFEYIEFLKVFKSDFPEGEKYQYVCGRTDIQASHMAGYQQPEGKCVLFMNDIFGINSLGESLRMVLSGFENKKLLIFIWHPILNKVMDHFNLHRPPMVWTNVGPEICKYYVRKESDASFIDFHGGGPTDPSTQKATSAIAEGKPLIVVNMIPEQERDFTSLDVRIRAHTSSADAKAASRKKEHYGGRVR